MRPLTGGTPAWGAIKFTRTSVYTSVITDPDVLLREGKDTARMLGAGARAAAWVQSPGGADLLEALSIAMEGLISRTSGEGRPLKGIIVEGNSAVELLKPDIVIFMRGPSIKKGSEVFLSAADVVCGLGGIKACVSRVMNLISKKEAAK